MQEDQDKTTRDAGFMRTKIQKISIIAALIVANTYVSAQSFSNTIFFGDSNTDNGRYKYVPQSTTGGSAGVLATTGIYTTPGGLMWSAYLGNYFGVTVTPTAAPSGGNNYAAGNAHVSYGANGVIGENAWSATAQVSSYLTSTGGAADSNALYTVYIGTNDLKTPAAGLSGSANIVDPQNLSALSTLAGQTAGLVQQLSSAGARYILVPNITSTTKTLAAANAAGEGGVWTATWANSLAYYNQAVWNDIAAKGINFIPADFATVADYVLLNPARFGITNTNIATPACGAVAAINCQTANLVSPNAMNTYFFADTNGHASSAVQKIQADYVYGLLVAPSQISLLANQASISQIAMNNAYLDQVGYSFRAGASKTLGAWALGGTQQVNMTSSQTSTSSTPYSGAAGIDYQYNENVLLGGFVGYGQAQSNYGSGGNFTQSGTTLGAYTGYKNDAIWANGMLTYNWLSNNVNRVTPVGITSFSNTSSVNGSNASAALQAGYNFDYNTIHHGPVLGYAYVNTSINGFTESGNFNSLQFGSQNINSQVGSLGYQAQTKIGDWLPFVKAIYNSQLGNIDRNITTTLTTITAPSYTMPALGYGRNWTNLTAGIGYQIDPKTVLRASFTQQVALQSVTSYNAIVSLSSYF
jgi:outer membrane lipase/esterase